LRAESHDRAAAHGNSGVFLRATGPSFGAAGDEISVSRRDKLAAQQAVRERPRRPLGAWSDRATTAITAVVANQVACGAKRG